MPPERKSARSGAIEHDDLLRHVCHECQQGTAPTSSWPSAWSPCARRSRVATVVITRLRPPASSGDTSDRQLDKRGIRDGLFSKPSAATLAVFVVATIAACSGAIPALTGTFGYCGRTLAQLPKPLGDDPGSLVPFGRAGDAVPSGSQSPTQYPKCSSRRPDPRDSAACWRGGYGCRRRQSLLGPDLGRRGLAGDAVQFPGRGARSR